MDFDLTKAQQWNVLAWIINNRIVNENGFPIEFDDHRFLIEPYLDQSPRQVIRKCAQIGWSVLAIIKSFHLAMYTKANIIHTFPSRNMSKDFVIPKVNPLIYNNKCVKDFVVVDSVTLKQIGDRFIYYRGTYEQTEAISISAHVLVNDEYDRSNQQVVKTYRSRLDDAKRERPDLGWEWQFSNPSVPGRGVDVLWQKSDQKLWFIKCRKCGYEGPMTWPDSIDVDRKVRMCSRCHEAFNRDDLVGGRWVAQRESDISGYHISQLFVPWIPVEDIIEDSEGDPDIFYNFTLGLPYISKDTSVTRDTIIKCLAPGYNPRDNVAMGVDNGIRKHYVIGNRKGIFKVGVTDDWKEIEDMRNLYDAEMVIDALPYPTVPSRLVETYPGKVYLHYYQQDKKGFGITRWEDRVAKSDRTKIIDHVVAELNRKEILFNLTGAELDEYIDHWTSMYRTIAINNQGIAKPAWETAEGKADHYAHATVLWRVALERTLSQGGIVNSSSVDAQGHIDRHPEVGADNMVPGLKLDKVIERAIDSVNTGKGWKTY